MHELVHTRTSRRTAGRGTGGRPALRLVPGGKGVGLLERNAAAIARYVEHVRPRIPRGSHAPETPMNRKERGKSTSVLSAKGEWLVEENREAAGIIEGLLDEMKRGEKTLRGVSLRWMVRELEEDPAAARNWKRRRTPEESHHAEVWWQACLLAARVLLAERPGYELVVVVHPEETEVLEAETPLLARNAENNARSRRTAQGRYRVLAAELLGIMEAEGCTAEAAIGMHRDRLERLREAADHPSDVVRYGDVSPATCYRALAFVRREGEDAAS